MIAVFGATGRVGGKVAAMLIESGLPVKALVRSAEKAAPLKNGGADIVVGSLLNRDDVSTTIDGCDSAFLMTPTNRQSDDYVEQEIIIGRNYGDALKDSDVGHALYMSVIGARQNTGIPHFDSKAVVEDAISESGVDCTFLRPTFFMENLLGQARSVQQKGIISLPLPPDKALPMVSTEDIAYAAVQSLRRGGQGKTEEYDMLGPKDYRMTEVAEIIEKTISKSVSYRELSEDDARQIYQGMGMSPKALDDYLMMFRVYKRWNIQGDRNKVYDEFNFEPTTLETVMTAMAGAFAAQNR